MLPSEPFVGPLTIEKVSGSVSGLAACNVISTAYCFPMSTQMMPWPVGFVSRSFLPERNFQLHLVGRRRSRDLEEGFNGINGCDEVLPISAKTLTVRHDDREGPGRTSHARDVVAAALRHNQRDLPGLSWNGHIASGDGINYGRAHAANAASPRTASDNVLYFVGGAGYYDIPPDRPMVPDFCSRAWGDHITHQECSLIDWS